jgi:hypothetical protein
LATLKRNRLLLQTTDHPLFFPKVFTKTFDDCLVAISDIEYFGRVGRSLMLPPPGVSPITRVVTDAILTTASSVIDSLTATIASNSQIPTSVAFSTASIASIASATATTVATSGSHQGPKDGEESGECKLLGPFALFIQAALGALALLSLVFKRYRERPQRPVKIWAFDASKQIFGSVLLHIANLLMSMLSAGQLAMKITQVDGSLPSAGKSDKYRPNPCSFYLLNLAIDVSIDPLYHAPSRPS